MQWTVLIYSQHVELIPFLTTLQQFRKHKFENDLLWKLLWETRSEEERGPEKEGRRNLGGQRYKMSVSQDNEAMCMHSIVTFQSLGSSGLNYWLQPGTIIFRTHAHTHRSWITPSWLCPAPLTDHLFFFSFLIIKGYRHGWDKCFFLLPILFLSFSSQK